MNQKRALPELPEWMKVLRPRPVETVTVIALAISYIVVCAYGWSFSFLFTESLGHVLIQLNWLLPCFFGRFLFALFQVPPRKARIFYLIYFFGLTLVFFGSRIETALLDTKVLGKPSLLITNISRINLLFFCMTVTVAALKWLVDRRHSSVVIAAEIRQDLFVVRLLVSLLLCFALYSNLKPMIPVIHPALLDGFFYKLDRLLFFGSDPFVWLNSFNSPAFIRLMSLSYFFFFFFIIYGFTGSLLFGSKEMFEKTLASFVIAYYIGIGIHIALPAIGPAFIKQTGWIFANTQTDKLKIYLMEMYMSFRNGSLQTPTRVFGGLAAFPSLHVAHSLLFMYYLWRSEKIIPFLLIIPFGLLVLSTIYLGWHYVIDIPGGVLVAILSFLCVKALYPEVNRKTGEV